MNENEIIKLRVMKVDDRNVPAKYIEAFNSYLDKVVIPHFEKQIAEKDQNIQDLSIELSEQSQNLIDAEEHIDNLELQLREQYQLVDEKDEEIEKIRKEATEEIKFLHRQYDRCDRARKKVIKQLKDQRRQICEEAKSKIEKIIEKQIKQDSTQQNTYDKILDVLDQIEKGE